MPYYKIEGTHNAVVESMGSDHDYLIMTDEDPAKELDTFRSDLSRTSYLSKHLTKEDIQESLEKDFHIKRGSYLQGDLNAGAVEDILKLLTVERHTSGEISDDIRESFKSVKVCYVDNDGKTCGFCMVTQKNPKNPEQLIYAIAVSRNMLSDADKRHMMLITDKDFLYDKNFQLESIPQVDILKSIKDQLQSEVLFEAIQLLIPNGVFASKTVFDHFGACLVANENCYPRIKAFNRVVTEYNQEKTQIINPEKEIESKQSIFSRNRAAIAGLFSAMTLAVGLAIGVVLFASPLGLLTIPLVMGAIALAGVGVAAMAIISSRKLFGKEKSLKQYKVERDDRIKEADDRLNNKIEAIKKINEEPHHSPSTRSWGDPSTRQWAPEPSPPVSKPSVSDVELAQSQTNDGLSTQAPDVKSSSSEDDTDETPSPHGP